MPDNPVQEPTADEIDLARRIAYILGPSSAAADAVADYAKRAEAGERPICIQHGGSWFVMPISTWESAAR